MSRRIQNTEVLEDVRADSGLEAALGDEVDFPAKKLAEFLLHVGVSEEVHSGVGEEFDENIDIGVVTEFTSGGGAEESEFANLIAAAEVGDLG